MVLSKFIGISSVLAVSGICCLAPHSASAAPVNFSGDVELILVQESASVFAPFFPLGTAVSGTIDDPGGEGSIGGIAPGSSTGISIPFTCCIFAGQAGGAADIGLELNDDETLDADTANALNSLFGAGTFSTGQLVDIVDLEGDTFAGAGRLEAGLSFLFEPSFFGPGSTPDILQDAAAALGGLFFISEFDSNEDDVFSAVGRLTSLGPAAPTPIPLPSGIVLMLTALGAVGALRFGRSL